MSRVREQYKNHFKPMDARAEAERVAALWFPTAADLELPDVPWEDRKTVRIALTCLLGKVPIQTCDGSWLIAQAITDLANSPRVEYVEGLMSTERGNKVIPGAWNLVHGCIVSLFCEASNRTKPEVWLYEPLKSYSLPEIYETRRAGHGSCSGHEWRKTAVLGTQSDSDVLAEVFSAPLQRMLERKQTHHPAIILDWK
jgi:hypothetical protein